MSVTFTLYRPVDDVKFLGSDYDKGLVGEDKDEYYKQKYSDGLEHEFLDLTFQNFSGWIVFVGEKSPASKRSEGGEMNHQKYL